MRTPPTARGLPWLGVAHRVSRDKFGFAQEFADEYGDVVRLPMPGRRHVYLVSSAELVSEVFVHAAQTHCKGVMLNAAMQPVPGTPIPVMEGEQWRRTRRLVTPFFSRTGLAGVLPTMDAILDRHVDRLDRHADSGATVDMAELLSLASIDVMMQTILNREQSHASSQRITRYFRRSSEGASIRWSWFWLPMPLRFVVSAHRDILATPLMLEMFRFVRDTKAAAADGDDLFSTLRNTRFDDGGSLSERQLLAEMFTFVFAGFETTAAALSWTIALLALHPEAMARAYAEVESLGRTPTPGEINRLPYLRACWDEAQRIQGLPYYSRDSTADQILGGYFIPAGSVLLCSPHALQHDIRYWTEPESYRPERWLGDAIDRNAFLPFGIGERRCVGATMANVEGVLYLAKALRRFDFTVRPGWTPRRRFRMTTIVEGGVPVSIRRRHGAAGTAPTMTKESL